MTDARAVLHRCDELARCSEEPGRLTRRFGTPALAAARDLVAGWMREAGLEPRVDAAGNLLGARGDGPRVLLGSHLDTVVDAGRYDGPLGVLAAIAVAQRLPDVPLEVAAFADEEGARFGTAYLGSALLAGRFEERWLDLADADGVTVRSLVGDVAVPPRRDVTAYAELHIEQGPVLEALDAPVGAVTAIAGQTRARVTFTGRAAHAGTTPMALRSDALVAAAAWVLEVHALARATPGLVATVGELRVEPGAVNVVPGRVTATLDVRHADDAVREHAVQTLLATVEAELLQSNPAVACDDTGFPADLPRLASGAGHDAVMLAAICPVSMVFVRSPGGISHHPDEAVREPDVAVALDVLTDWVAARC